MNVRIGNLFAGSLILSKWISNVSFYVLYIFQAGYSFVSLWVLTWDLVPDGGFSVFSEYAEVLCYVTAMDWVAWGLVITIEWALVASLSFHLSISPFLGSLSIKTTFNKLMKKRIKVQTFTGRNMKVILSYNFILGMRKQIEFSLDYESVICSKNSVPNIVI